MSNGVPRVVLLPPKVDDEIKALSKLKRRSYSTIFNHLLMQGMSAKRRPTIK